MARWIKSLPVLLLAVVWPGTAVHGYPIITNSVDEVLVCASDVVRVAWPTEKQSELVIQRVFRGGLQVGDTVKVHALPGAIEFAKTMGALRSERLDEEVKPKGLFLALYEMDGRYHVVGHRPTHGITPHSSVWMVRDDDRVRAFQQLTNPGSPQPVQAKPPGRAAFEAQLEELVKAHPFKGADHRSVPLAHRATFRNVTEPAIDWYERRLVDHTMIAPDRVALADKIVAYAQKAPTAMAIHCFDALQLVAPSNYYSTEHKAELVEYMTALVTRVGVPTFEALILYELDKGPYMTRNRSALLAVARRTDRALYEKGVKVLVDLGKRQHHDEGLAAYFALRDNGETKLAKEVQEAQGWR